METMIIAIICLILFAVQLLLCFKVKKLALKLIPAVLLLVALALFTVLTMTATGWDSLAYIVFAILSAIFLIPCAAGWVVWAVCYFIQKRKRSEAGR